MNAQAQYTYTTLSVPGAVSTYAYGISGNNIVGWYRVGSTHNGFLYDGRSYNTFAVPGAQGTYATGIDGNNIAGYYYNGGTMLGFLATPVAEPSALVLLALGSTALLACHRRSLVALR
jgi:hypothetical protein